MSFIRYFIAVPRIVLKDNRYSSTDKLVLGMINSLSNNKGYCYAKNSMEEKFQYKRKEYKRKNNINNKRVAPIPIWMKHPELCQGNLATPEEQAEMTELLKEFKD